MLLHGKAITAHAAAVEGAPFLAMVGVGFDAQALGKLSQAMKRLSGRAAYAPAILRTLLSPIPEFNAVVDGVAYQANWIIVTNVANYGGGFLLSPESHISSPGLTAVLMRIPSRFALVQTLISLGLGMHLKRANVSLIPCKTVHISAPSPQAIQIDGELCGATPAVVAQTDLEFRLITPEPRGEG